MKDIQVTWDQRKRLSNLKKHKLDFADAREVFQGPVVESQDDEITHEYRWKSYGLLHGIMVQLVYTEIEPNKFHMISFRKAQRRERKDYEKKLTKLQDRF